MEWVGWALPSGFRRGKARPRAGFEPPDGVLASGHKGRRGAVGAWKALEKKLGDGP